MEFACVQSSFLPIQEAKVSIFNRGFLFGDGVFTTLKVKKGKILFLKEHLKKLQEQCDFIKLDYPDIKENFLYEFLHLNKANEGEWRLKLIVTSSDDTDSLVLSQRSSLFICTLTPYAGLFFNPVRLTVYPYPCQFPLAKIKSLASLERLKIKDFAVSKGFYDAIVLNPELYFLETAFANLFWKDRQGLHLPELKLPYYVGVTIENIIQQAFLKNYPVFYEKALSIKEDAQIYICNSMIGLCSVETINDLNYTRDVSFEKEVLSYFP